MTAAARMYDPDTLLNHLSENIKGAIIYQMVTSKTQSGKRFTYVGGCCDTALGVSADEVLQNPNLIYELIVPQDRALLAVLEEKAQQSQTMLHTELRIKHNRTGAVRWFDLKSAPRPLNEEETIWDGIVSDITEKKKMEKKLRESEARFRHLFTKMLDGFALHEIICNEHGQPADYRFLMVNPAFERLTGLKARDIIGKTMRDILPESEPLWIETFGDVATTGSPACFEAYAPPFDKYFTVSAFSPAPGQFACIVEDITERKNAKKALIDTEYRYEQLAQQSNTFSWEVDTNGLYLDASKSCQDITGYAPGELIGQKHFYDIAPPEDRTELRQHALLKRENGETFYKRENRILSKFGEIIWVSSSAIPVRDEQGVITSFRGMDSDITARKLAEIGMARLAAGVEQAAEAVIITNTNGQIEYVNPAFTAITGYSREEALGKNPRLLKSGTHDYLFYQELWQTLREGKVWRGKLINQRKDGSLFTQESAISPVRGPNGNIVNFVAVTHDISDTLGLQQQLLHSQKMESIGRLAGGIAHDFNNVLMGIMGYTDLAKEKIPQDHPAIEDLDLIHEMANRSASLTRQLLTFARKQAIQPVVLNLNESTTPILKMLKRLVGDAGSLEWKADQNLWPIKMDPAQLDQILANLCVNAKDAIKGRSGRIMISASNISIDETYCKTHPEANPGDYVCCAVSDNGYGIPAAMLGKIFDPFFTTKKIGEGTGLGLSTVFGIIQQNNGFIEVQSKVCHGTTFKLYFPRHIETTFSEKPQQKKTHTPDVDGTGKTILVVEDEESVRNMTSRILQRMHFQVISAADPQAAIRICIDHPEKIDIVLSDIVMPGMNGKEMSEVIHDLRPHVAIIYMSGYTSDVAIEKTRNGDTPVFLAKPFTKDHLCKALIHALQIETPHPIPTPII
jgi:two-component system, cell cycle sensor histidine kinase and response regulator CckA